MNELVIAGQLLNAVAARISEYLASFASWLIGSYAAILALLLANLESISTVLPTQAIGKSAFVFLVAVGLHVIQRYLAAMVLASAAAAREGMAISVPASTDMEVVFHQFEKATLWPARLLVRRTLAKVRRGDFAASGRMNGKLAQIQGFLVLAQIGFVVWAASRLIGAL